jgi:hypothetical protein
VEFDYNGLYADVKKHSKVVEIAKAIGMTDSNMRRSLNAKQMCVHNLIKICSLIERHPCEYFTRNDQSYKLMVTEPEIVKYMAKHEENISTLLEMRNQEVKYLKGEINALKEKNEALKKENELLRTKK